MMPRNDPGCHAVEFEMVRKSVPIDLNLAAALRIFRGCVIKTRQLDAREDNSKW